MHDTLEARTAPPPASLLAIPAAHGSATHAIAVRPAAASSLVIAGGAALLLLVYAQTLQSLAVPHFSGAILGAILLTSTLSSIAGFAFSAICGAILLHLMAEPVKIVELMVVCSIGMQGLAVWALRRSIDWKVLPAFLAGGVISLPAGVWLLLHMPQGPFAIFMGLFLIAYGGLMLFRRSIRLSQDFGPMGDGVAGFLGGITGGLAGFPGALVTIWCSLKPWDKRQQRAVYQPFILIMQVLALIALHVMRGKTGIASGSEITACMYVPAALLGTWFGLKVFDRLSDRQFAVAMNILLIASGAGMLVR